MSAMRIGTSLSEEKGNEADELREHLSRPVRTFGPQEPWSPEYDIINAVQRLRSPGGEVFRLERAATELLSDCHDEVQSGRRSPETIALVARLGFLCSSLKLAVDGAPFFAIGLDLVIASGIGLPIDPQDLFQILRAAGRAEVPHMSTELRRLFWSSLLTVAHKGIRTLAAQNIIRLDPARGLVELQSLISAETNASLLVHDLVERFGEQKFVEAATIALEPEWIGHVASSLSDAGYCEAALALDAARMKMPFGKSAGWRVDEIRRVLANDDQPVNLDGAFVSQMARAFTMAGLQQATRSETVRRFMSHGGVSVGADYADRAARVREELRPPSLVDA